MARERPRVVLFDRNPDDADTIAVADVLRQETVGGALMLAAAVVALLWANLALASAYRGGCVHLQLGPARPGALGRRRPAGDLLLRRRARAQARAGRRVAVASRPRPLVPVVAAVCGMVVPAVIYVVGQPRRADRPASGLGASRWRPTSPSPWPSWRSSAPAADRAAGLPAHPGHRRRPRRDPVIAIVLHPRLLELLWFLGALASRPVGAAAAARICGWYLYLPAGCALLVVHVQERHPRHRRRRAARSADPPRR